MFVRAQAAVLEKLLALLHQLVLAVLQDLQLLVRLEQACLQINFSFVLLSRFIEQFFVCIGELLAQLSEALRVCFQLLVFVFYLFDIV